MWREPAGGPARPAAGSEPTTTGPTPAGQIKEKTKKTKNEGLLGKIPTKSSMI